MSRPKINFIIDIIMMLVMMLAAGVGLLIKYVLLPGFKRNIKYGRDVDLTYWGLDRHQWGTVHLIISLVLVFLVLLHIILHWRQIKIIYCNLVRKRQQRIALAIGFLFACFFIAIGPLFITPQVVTAVGHGTGRLHELRNEEHPITESQRQEVKTEYRQNQDEHREHASLSEEIPVYGYMTLADVAQQYNVSAVDLARHLGVLDSETGTKLGQLRRQYNFRMSTIRSYIEKNRTSSE
jgi:hypothetical protein